MFRIDREPLTPLRRRFIDDFQQVAASLRKVLAWWRCQQENAGVQWRATRRTASAGRLGTLPGVESLGR
jgi:hypothetical protein